MRLVCLYFPRLGIELALRQAPHLQGRSVALIAGVGEDAPVVATSAMAAERGVLGGMVAREARRRDPSCAFLPDNVGDALDELERLGAIVRARVTPRVEAGGRDHLFVSLEATDGQFASEALAVARLQEMAAAWSGLAVRAGVGSPRGAALVAARAARFRPVIDSGPALAPEPPIAPLEPRSISVRVALGPDVSPERARAKVAAALGRLAMLLEGRGEGFREVRVEVENGRRSVALLQRLPSPSYDPAAVFAAFGPRLPADVLAGAMSVRVELGRLCPDARVRAWCGRPGQSRPAARPARYRQMLLRAAG